MNEIRKKGGARVGWVSTSWPLASLLVTPRELSIKVGLIGKYSFSREQVISIEKHNTFPFLAWGIQIRHNVESYPEQIIFYSFGHPDNLIRSVSQTGFNPGGDPSATTNARSSIKRGSPVKIWPLILAILIWNILFIADFTLSTNTQGKPGTLAALATALAFITSLLIKTTKRVANLFLKPGRHVGEITPMLNLLLLVTGLISIVLTATLLVGSH